MSRQTDRLWRERTALRYLDALDSGALEAVAAMWEEASADPELEALLRDLDEALSEEEGLGADFQADAIRIVELARRSFPDAFVTEEPNGPLTASDVVRRLEAEPEFRRFGPSDRLAHARLLSEAATIPDHLGQPGLDRWLEGLGVVASDQYRRAFRKVAVLMTMARCQQEGRLAAARQATPEVDIPGGKS